MILLSIDVGIRNLAYILLILTTLFWSGNFIVGKAASTYEIPPFSLNFYRWLFAGLILLPFTIKEIIQNIEFIKKNFKIFMLVSGILLTQISLGIFTLISGLNIILASLHQITSVLLVFSVLLN